jgi:HEAT repeat-containing protein 5
MLTVAPTLLYLATGVLEECAVEGQCTATSEPVASALQCLRALAGCALSKQETDEGERMRTLLQSALAKVLDLAKGDCQRLEQTSVLLAVAVFALHADSRVLATPTLLYPSVNHFKLCLQSTELVVIFFASIIILNF